MKKFICVILMICVGASLLSLAACNDESGKLSEYNITASYNAEEGKLSGRVDFTFRNSTENELDTLKFNLYGNAFREGAKYSPVSPTYQNQAYYAGVNYGKTEISNVTNCEKYEVCGEDENVLAVTLSEPVYPGEKVELSIDYTLSLAKVNHRTGITQNTVNLGNFYPILCAYTSEGFAECPYYSCGDPFLSECADYTVNFELPAGYTAATSGKKVSEKTSGDKVLLSYTLSSARDFAAVLSNNFKTVTKDLGYVQVTYYYYSDTSPQVSLTAACESLEYFSDEFGKYVYPTLSVVQTGFCYGGMEYPALTMISDKLSSDDSVYTIVHETAHQWWYAMVGSNQLTCAWQDEGLAEYSALMFFESHPTYAFTKTGLLGSATKAYKAYYSVYKQIFGKADTSMLRRLDEFESDYEYTNIAYNKGLILFDMLRQSIGDEKFSAGLRNYFEKNLYRIASYEDLIGCFLSGGNDLEGFFNSFLNGKIII